MTASPQEAQRILLVEAAKSLIREASEAARHADPHSSDWRFYQGVETAAIHVLHPAIALVRDGTGWLDAKDPAFRKGYEQGSILLGTVSTLPEPPLRPRLPQPPEPSHHA